MRLRKVKHAETTIQNHPDKIIEIQRESPVDLSPYLKEGPLEIEIGAGKGQFIDQLSRRSPETFFIAVERYDSVIVRALEKFIDQPRDNVLLVKTDAAMLEQCLPHKSVDTIHLNFSDPWPKKRHAKRRLTHPSFLLMYRMLLKEEGVLEFKTDNRHFFEYSLRMMNATGMVFTEISLDLHEDYDPETLIMTEFEEKFSKEGPIYKLKAMFKEEPHEEDL
ncbi:MAG: tRNA (guanosine(46)-N7)-methyltransferase TrmB [Candidatus Izemoplasmataceae bacterium]